MDKSEKLMGNQVNNCTYKSGTQSVPLLGSQTFLTQATGGQANACIVIGWQEAGRHFHDDVTASSATQTLSL